MTKDADKLNNPTEAIGVYFIDMDTSVHEEVHLNEDSSFTIFINSKLNAEAQMLAYQHAIEHIMNDDFSKESADDIEIGNMNS